MVGFHILSLTTVKIPLSGVAAHTPLMLATIHPPPKLLWILYTLQLFPLSNLCTSVLCVSNFMSLYFGV